MQQLDLAVVAVEMAALALIVCCAKLVEIVLGQLLKIRRLFRRRPEVEIYRKAGARTRPISMVGETGFHRTAEVRCGSSTPVALAYRLLVDVSEEARRCRWRRRCRAPAPDGPYVTASP